jgi:hypothetical protein
LTGTNRKAFATDTAETKHVNKRQTPMAKQDPDPTPATVTPAAPHPSEPTAADLVAEGLAAQLRAARFENGDLKTRNAELSRDKAQLQQNISEMTKLLQQAAGSLDTAARMFEL